MTSGTAYISGPRRDYKFFNFPAFDAAANRLRRLGYEVINPADMDREDGFDAMQLPEDHDWSGQAGFDLRRALCRDCHAVCQSSHIAMLSGWQDSIGARIEHDLAVAVGVKVLDEYGFPLVTYHHDKAEIDEKSNPKDCIGSRKPPLDLIPASADIMESQVLALGARKYGKFNWRDTSVRASVYVAALRRHLAQWFDGENVDPESKVNHLAHCRANISILIDALTNGTLIDDRVPGNAYQLIKQHTKSA